MKTGSKRGLRFLIVCLIMAVVLIMPVGSVHNYDNLSGLTAVWVSAATKVNQPVANLDEGSYLDTQKVTLTCKTKGAAIYYTTNGTTPTKNSTKYTKAINVKKSIVLRAIAINNGVKSKVLNRYYYIYDYTEIYSDVERYQLAIEKNKVSELSLRDQKVCKEIQEIIRETITDTMSDYEKVKAIHDYIVNHCQYDHDNYEAYSIPEVSYSIEGVILNGVAVCQGYAETFQLFMNLLDIENQFISGYANNGSHAWNLVEVNDKWYQVDTTWDDPYDESGEQFLRYDYFLITDSWMSSDHSWTESLYNKCTSDDMMYKQYDGCIIKSIKDYEAKFTKLYNKGETTITILYPENAKPDMSFYWELSGSQGYSYYELVKFGKYYVFTVLVE